MKDNPLDAHDTIASRWGKGWRGGTKTSARRQACRRFLTQSAITHQGRTGGMSFTLSK